VSYELSENAYSCLYQARDAIRSLKHASQETRDGGALDSQLIASYLTLMDEQLSVAIQDAGSPKPE
jgi:hypothetical protein